MSSKTTQTSQAGGKLSKAQVSRQAEAEKALLDLAKQQIGAINAQTAFQTTQFEQLQPLLEQQKQFGEQALQQAQANAPVQQELLQRQLDILRSGGAATPEQIALIDQTRQGQLAAGESDILRFAGQAQEQLREELAPQLGLRSTDTPILDRGARVSEEAVRQQGVLANNLSAQAAQQQLLYPLQSNQVMSGLGLDQQQLQEATRQFQQGLAQQAFLNRLNLTGQTGNQGLGLATGVPGAQSAGALSGQLGQQALGYAPVTATSSTSDPLGQLSTVAGGAGGLLLGAALLSSRDAKNISERVDEEKMSLGLAELPIYKWKYKGDNTEHIGPMAEDFRDIFGVGDGKTISVIDALGVLMAAAKENA